MTIPDSQYRKMLEKIQTVKKLQVFKDRYEMIKKILSDETKVLDKSALTLIELLVPEE